LPLRDSAAAIASVGQHHDRLAPLLLGHQLFRRQQDCVVQLGPAAGPLPAGISAAATRVPAALGILTAGLASIVVVIPLVDLQQVQRVFQFLARRREVLQKLHLAVEVDQERLVFVLAQHVLEELVAGVPLFTQHAPLALAGIDQQSQRQRQVRFPRKVADRLRMPVLRQSEVVLGQIRDDLQLLVPNRGQNVNYFDISGKRRRRLCRQAQRRKSQQQAPPGNMVFGQHVPREMRGGAKSLLRLA